MKKSHPVSASEPVATVTTVYVAITKTWQKKKARSAIDLARIKARRLFNCPGKIYICITQTPPPPGSLSMPYSQLIA